MRTQEHADRRPTSFRRSLAVTASGALIAALAACGGGAGGDEAAASGAKIDAKADPASVKGTITLMRNPAEITEETIAEFNEKYPGVEVEAIDYDAVKLKALLAAGDPPDLFRTEAPAVGSLVGQRQLMDLTAPLEEIGISDETSFDAAELYVIDGKRYGVPFDWSPDFTIFVNHALFEKAGVPVPDPAEPLSWEQVGELARKLTVTSGSTTSQFGLGGAWDTFSPARVISTRLAEAGETLYSEDQKSIELAGNPKAVEALEFMADLAKEGVTHSPVNPSASWSGQEFSDGQVAMVVYGYWFNRVVNSGETAVGTEYTVLPGPYWEDADARVNPTITGTGMVMSAKTKDPQAAWAFYSWYLTGERAQDNAKTGSGFPVLETDSEFLPKEQPVDKQAYDVALAEAEVAPALQFNRYYDDAVFTDSYNKYVQEYVGGKLTIEEMATSIENDVNAAIQDGVDQQG
jgi:multiple sugar transport system substrate-binding protein